MLLALRSLFYTILKPGVIAGVIPYILTYNQELNQNSWIFGLGVVLFDIGFLITVHCIILFAKIGKGTLSPADPTKNLVIEGLYKHSRNPMYIGVLLIVASEAMIYGSYVVLSYSFAIFILFHSFIVYFEEPRLKKEFGNSYELYSTKVARWL